MSGRKKKILFGILFTGILLIVVGTSYALWQITLRQVGQNTITTGCFKLTFEGVNDINLENAYPLKDDELDTFFNEAVPYHFTITNMCDSQADASINIETLGVSGKRLSDSYVNFKLYNGINVYGNGILNKQNINENKVLDEALDAYSLYTFVLKEREVREFDLLLYMNPDTPTTLEVMDASWLGKVTINSLYVPKEILDRTLRNTLEYDDFFDVDDPRAYSKLEDDKSAFSSEYSYDINKVVFQNTISSSFNGEILAEFDESANDSNTVRGYIVEEYDDVNDDYFIIAYIQADGKMYLPEDSTAFFTLLDNVQSIEGLENLDTSRVRIMTKLFDSLSNLDSLDVSSFDTSNVVNMDYMFNNMTFLESLDVSGFDTSRVTKMDYMFYGLSFMTSFDLSSFNTSNVRNMSHMFGSCGLLTTLDLSGFKTKSATNMSSMFYSMDALTSLDISNFDTTNVTNMKQMFYYDVKLTTLDVSHFNTSNVTNMQGMFEHCTGLTTLDVSGFDTSKVTNMASMFDMSINITALDVSGFDTSNVTNMSRMFLGLRYVTELDVSGFNTSKVTDMSNMFTQLTTLTKLDVSGFDTSNVTNMSEMFQALYVVEELDVSHFNTSKVTNMSKMFGNCNMIKSLDLSSFDTSKVVGTGMQGMFFRCDSIESIDLSSFNTSNVTDLSGMFSSCKKLKSLDLSSFDTRKVTKFDTMFNFVGATSITYGENFIYKSGATVKSMFWQCNANKPSDSSWASVVF